MLNSLAHLELTLARMAPLLEFAEFPFPGALEAAASGGLISWVKFEGGGRFRVYAHLDGEDAPDPFAKDFFNGVAAEFIARIESGFQQKNLSFDDSFHYPSVFWEQADAALQAGGGYSSPTFAGIKTTLWGVEQNWQAESEKILLGSPSVNCARLKILEKMRSVMNKRKEVAHLVATCAGWLDS